MAAELNDQSTGEWGVVASATAEGLLRLYDQVRRKHYNSMTAVNYILVTALTDSDNICNHCSWSYYTSWSD